MKKEEIIKILAKDRNELQIKCDELELANKQQAREIKILKTKMIKYENEINKLKENIDVITADRDLIIQDYDIQIKD